jgi:hypothetical protein
LSHKSSYINFFTAPFTYLHIDGQLYVFEVRESYLVRPNTAAFALQDLEDKAFLTLITC